MKTRVIKFSDLEDCKCWSALRYLDSCERCKEVNHCKLSEAGRGRKRLSLCYIIKEVELLAKKYPELADMYECTLIKAEASLKALELSRHPDIKEAPNS